MVSVIAYILHFSKNDCINLELEEVVTWYRRAQYIIEEFINKGM